MINIRQFLATQKPFTLCTWVSMGIGFLASLIALRLLPDDPSWSFLQILYYLAYTFGKNFIVSYIFQLIFAVPLLLFNRRKIAYILMLIINGLWVIFLLANSFVYQQFRMGINLAMLQMTFLSQGQIVIFSTTMKIWIGVLAIVCLLLTASVIWLAVRLQNRPVRAGRYALIPILLFVTGNLFYTTAFALNKTSILTVHERIPLDYPLHMNRFLVRVGVLKEEDIKKSQMKVKTGGTFNYPLQPVQCRVSDRPYNVVFLFVDSLRADMLNAEVMPHTTQFAKTSATTFDSHYSGGNSTRAGIFSAFYGIPSSYWHAALAVGEPSVISKSFVDSGYALQAFTGAGLTSPEFNRTVFANVADLRSPPHLKSVLDRDTAAVNDFIDWADVQTARKKPFFSFIFLDNVHAYDFPEDEASTKFKPSWDEINHLALGPNFDRTPYFNRYKNAVHWADKSIAHVIEALRKRHLLDNTVLVISSDHGEEFNDYGNNFWGHNSDFTDAQIKVPLVVHWPGKSVGHVSYTTTAHDFAPTFLRHVLKCDNPTSDYSVGYDLWSKENRNTWFHSGSYSSNAFVTDKRIFVINNLGVLEVKTPHYANSPDTSTPSFMSQAMLMMRRYLK